MTTQKKQLDLQAKKEKYLAIKISQDDLKLLKDLAQKNKASLSEVCRAIFKKYFLENKGA